MTPDEEIELKEALMRAGLSLRQKQAFWETPRNLVIIGTIAVATAGIAGVVGFWLAQNPQQTINVHLDASLVASPAVKP